MKASTAPTHHYRSAALLAAVAFLVFGIGADVALPLQIHVPIALAVLAVAAYLALHDRIHSVWLTHHPRRAVPSRIPPRTRRDQARPSHLRASRPGWM